LRRGCFTTTTSMYGSSPLLLRTPPSFCTPIPTPTPAAVRGAVSQFTPCPASASVCSVQPNFEAACGSLGGFIDGGIRSSSSCPLFHPPLPTLSSSPSRHDAPASAVVHCQPIIAIFPSVPHSVDVCRT
jgi:hypothetical protein